MELVLGSSFGDVGATLAGDGDRNPTTRRTGGRGLGTFVARALFLLNYQTF